MGDVDVKFDGYNKLGFNSSIFTNESLYDEEGYLNNTAMKDICNAIIDFLSNNDSDVPSADYVGTYTLDYDLDELHTGKWITADEIREIIDNELNVYNYTGAYGEIITVRDEYELVNSDYFKDLQIVSGVAYEKGIKDYDDYDYPYMDCDDYSFILDGDIRRFHPQIAYGYMTSRGYRVTNGEEIHHAHFFAIDENKDFQLVEPQGIRGFETNDGDFWINVQDRKMIYM